MKRTLGTTPFNLVLIATAAVVFLYMKLKGLPWLHPSAADLAKFGASYGPNLARGQYWRYFTSLVTEASILQFLFDFLAAYAVGIFACVFAPIEFAVIFLLTGLLGVVSSVAFAPLSPATGLAWSTLGLYSASLGYCVARKNLTKFTKRPFTTALVPTLALIGLVAASRINLAACISAAASLTLGAALGYLLTMRKDHQRAMFAGVLSILLILVGVGWRAPRNANILLAQSQIAVHFANFKAGLQALKELDGKDDQQFKLLQQKRDILANQIVKSLEAIQLNMKLLKLASEPSNAKQIEASRAQIMPTLVRFELNLLQLDLTINVARLDQERQMEKLKSIVALERIERDFVPALKGGMTRLRVMMEQTPMRDDVKKELQNLLDLSERKNQEIVANQAAFFLDDTVSQQFAEDNRNYFELTQQISSSRQSVKNIIEFLQSNYKAHLQLASGEVAKIEMNSTRLTSRRQKILVRKISEHRHHYLLLLTSAIENLQRASIEEAGLSLGPRGAKSISDADFIDKAARGLMEDFDLERALHVERQSARQPSSVVSHPNDTELRDFAQQSMDRFHVLDVSLGRSEVLGRAVNSWRANDQSAAARKISTEIAAFRNQVSATKDRR